MRRRSEKRQDREYCIAPDIETFVEKTFPPVGFGESDVRLCARCGVEFKVKSRNHRYCSAGCRKEDEKERLANEESGF